MMGVFFSLFRAFLNCINQTTRPIYTMIILFCLHTAVSKFKAVIEEYSNKKIPDFEGKDGSVTYRISK